MDEKREARAEKGDLRLRDKPVWDKTREQLDAVRLILDPENPIGPRTCCYHLLSIGLLDSTDDFQNMSKKINDARKRHEGHRDSLPDEGFIPPDQPSVQSKSRLASQHIRARNRRTAS
jgi:hypothetical protein